jgi:hypothetical protein
MLTTAKENGYLFTPFTTQQTNHGNTCIMRHDIDADPSAAYEMAKVEYANDVASTYLVMLRSPLYNLLNRHNSRYIEQILDMGHSLGLHYDAAFHKMYEFSQLDSIADEICVLETLFDTHVDVVSFHQPDADILRGDLVIPRKINTYNRSDMSGYHYISDSNRRFSHDNPFDVFKNAKYKNVHVLLHPLWWVYPEETPEDVWDTVIRNNFKLSQQQLLETEVVYGNRRTMSLVRSDILAGH